MKAGQLTWDVPSSRARRTIEIRVPFPTEPLYPPDAVHEGHGVARLRRFVPAFLSLPLSKLLVFEQKYGWYRRQGYSRPEARDKAWWHAGASPADSRHA